MKVNIDWNEYGEGIQMRKKEIVQVYHDDVGHAFLIDGVLYHFQSDPKMDALLERFGDSPDMKDFMEKYQENGDFREMAKALGIDFSARNLVPTILSPDEQAILDTYTESSLADPHCDVCQGTGFLGDTSCTTCLNPMEEE